MKITDSLYVQLHTGLLGPLLDKVRIRHAPAGTADPRPNRSRLLEWQTPKSMKAKLTECLAAGDAAAVGRVLRHALAPTSEALAAACEAAANGRNDVLLVLWNSGDGALQYKMIRRLANDGALTAIQLIATEEGRSPAPSRIATVARTSFERQDWAVAASLVQATSESQWLGSAVQALPALWAAVGSDDSGHPEEILEIVGTELIESSIGNGAPAAIDSAGQDTLAAAVAAMVVGSEGAAMLEPARAARLVQELLSRVDATDAQEVVAMKALEHLELWTPSGSRWPAVANAMLVKLRDAELGNRNDEA